MVADLFRHTRDPQHEAYNGRLEWGPHLGQQLVGLGCLHIAASHAWVT